MKEITIDNRLMGYIALFEKIGKIDVKECLENDDMVLFLVGEHKMGEMFKRNPNVMSELKEKINKHILVAEISKDLLSMVKNLYYRFKVKEIYISWKMEQTEVVVSVEQTEVGKVIGKEGRNIKLFKEALSRYFNVKSLSIKQ
ncbi:MAG: NusA-like transcription termination signal-binding factor [Candidatus Thermoplasmatota archaeon]|jgi:N utilization substance protein A|nr:NusA-like transcription termination signal-binding factor [Candidatus Thermoplasmatota archaeon]